MNLRDHNNSGWTNTINGTSTRNVFDSGQGRRLDMQTFVLGPQFAGETLTGMTITDTGGVGFSRVLFFAATVESNVPSPGAGLACVGVLRRRRVYRLRS